MLTVGVGYFLAAAVSIPVRHFFLGTEQTFEKWIESLFKFNAVYSAVGDNLRYIADVEKQIPDSDVLKVMAYVNGEHAETIYARAYHCSSNPVLAAEEFLADRGKYFICHNRKKQSEKCC